MVVVARTALLELRPLAHPAPPVGYLRADATELLEMVVALAQAVALPPRKP
jgi:hypothetical protein